jgi:hypothetical protein
MIPFGKELYLWAMVFIGSMENIWALHTTAINREDKGFQQFDWWRAKVCSLGLHTRGQ